MKDYKEIVSNERLFNVGMAGIFNTGFIKLTDAGICSVLWCEDEYGWEHVSISPKKQTKIHTWQDMCQLKDIFFKDDEEALQLHPKKKEYVNVMDNCLHLWKPREMEIMNTLDQCNEALKRLERVLNREIGTNSKAGEEFILGRKTGLREAIEIIKAGE